MRGSRVLEATRRLRASLDVIADALLFPDVTRLVSAESDLAEALTEISTIHLEAPADRESLAAEIVRARAVLQRCRVLGAMVTDVTRVTFAAQGRSEGYGRSGNTAAALPMRGRDITTRI